MRTRHAPDSPATRDVVFVQSGKPKAHWASGDDLTHVHLRLVPVVVVRAAAEGPLALEREVERPRVEIVRASVGRRSAVARAVGGDADGKEWRDEQDGEEETHRHASGKYV
jgi:hypothetical protein